MMTKPIQYACGDGDWYFLEAAALKYGDGDIKRRLVPSMKKRDVYMMLYAYLITDKLKDFLKENCFGCSYDAPDQHSHMSTGTGCLQEWDDAVMFNFELVKPGVNVQQALDKVNEAMNWKITIPDKTSDTELYKIVCNPGDKVLNRLMNVPADYETYNLPDSYNKLFRDLEL
jgi:hypothetical protein